MVASRPSNLGISLPLNGLVAIQGNSQMKIDGTCHCGAIKYEAELNPAMVGICHCTDCQTLSGSAFRTAALVKYRDFQLTSGKPKTYIKVGENGRERLQAFCEICGTPIFSSPVEDEPETINVRPGTINQRRKLKPTFQGWHRSALPWLGELDSIRKIERQ
jgi:hypothetical protein